MSEAFVLGRHTITDAPDDAQIAALEQAVVAVEEGEKQSEDEGELMLRVTTLASRLREMEDLMAERGLRYRRSTPPPWKVPPEVPARRLQARLLDAGGPEVFRELRAGAENFIEIRVAYAGAKWSGPNDAPQGDTRRFHLVFFEPELAPEPQVSTVLVPERGASSTATFQLTAGDGVDRAEVRVILLHGNRVLQTALLRVPIVACPVAMHTGGAIDLESEIVVSQCLDDLDDHTPFDLAMVVSQNGRTVQATAIAGAYACLISLSDVDACAGKLTRKLSQFAQEAEELGSLSAPRVSELFNYLAYHGSLLYREVADMTHPALRRVLGRPRIQIVSVRSGDILPLEHAYTLLTPLPSAPLCPDAQDALATRRCSPSSCGMRDRLSTVVCPLGFWGLSRVIERQAGGQLPPGAKFGIPMNARSPARLEVLSHALFAATKRADAEASATTEEVRAAVYKATSHAMSNVSTWGAWVSAIAHSSPTLLVLIVHTVHNKVRDTPAMEIGDDDLLDVGNIGREHVRVFSSPPPVVLLIGCNTALAGDELERFPAAFLRAEAAIVLSTAATLLGRHAGPLTTRLLATLADMTNAGDVQFGDVLLATKQQLVAEGQVMALSLCAHGDAAWILCKAT